MNKCDTTLHSNKEQNNKMSSRDEEVNKLEIFLEELNSSLQNIEESPFKLDGVSSHTILNYTKRKLESAFTKLKSKVNMVLEKSSLQKMNLQ